MHRSSHGAEDLDESDDHYSGRSDHEDDDSDMEDESDDDMSANGAYYHDDDNSEEESGEEEDLMPEGDANANKSLRKSIANTLSMGGRPPVQDDDGEENILAQVLNICQCDVSSFVAGHSHSNGQE